MAGHLLIDIDQDEWTAFMFDGDGNLIDRFDTNNILITPRAMQIIKAFPEEDWHAETMQ